MFVAFGTGLCASSCFCPVFPGSPLGLACPVLVSSATFSVPLQGADSNTQPCHSLLSPLDEDGDHPQKLLVKWPCLGVMYKGFLENEVDTKPHCLEQESVSEAHGSPTGQR